MINVKPFEGRGDQPQARLGAVWRCCRWLLGASLTVVLVGLAVPVRDSRLVDGGGPSCGPIWRALSEPGGYGPVVSDWCHQAAIARIEHVCLTVLAAWLLGPVAYLVLAGRARDVSVVSPAAVDDGSERAVVLMSYWAPLLGVSLLLPLILWFAYRGSGVRAHIARAFDVQVLQMLVGSIAIFTAFVLSGPETRTMVLVICAGVVLLLALGSNAVLSMGAISGRSWASGWQPVLLRDRSAGTLPLSRPSSAEA